MLWPACSRGVRPFCVGGAAPFLQDLLVCLAVLSQPHLQAANRQVRLHCNEATRRDLCHHTDLQVTIKGLLF